MIAVAIAAVACAVSVMIEAQRERNRWATVRIINRRSTPLFDVRVIYPGGKREISRVPPGEEATCPIRIETEAKIRIEVGKGHVTNFGGVRGGSRPTVQFSD
jgi:hypothetical protein